MNNETTICLHHSIMLLWWKRSAQNTRSIEFYVKEYQYFYSIYHYALSPHSEVNGQENVIEKAFDVHIAVLIDIADALGFLFDHTYLSSPSSTYS